MLSLIHIFSAQGISKLDIVIATHPHADHIGGLIHIIDNMPVGEILDPGVEHTSQLFEDYLDAILAKEDITFTEARDGMIRQLGPLKIQIIHPAKPDPPVSYTHLDVYKRQAFMVNVKLVIFKDKLKCPSFILCLTEGLSDFPCFLH